MAARPEREADEGRYVEGGIVGVELGFEREDGGGLVDAVGGVVVDKVSGGGGGGAVVAVDDDGSGGEFGAGLWKGRLVSGG